MKTLHISHRLYTYLILLGYALLIFVLFIPAMRPNVVISQGDIGRQHYFYMSYLKDSVLAGRLPLWNPYLFLGEPFIASPYIAFWYPLTWLFVILPLPVAFLVHIMVHIWWGMVGMYMLSRIIWEWSNRPEHVIGACVSGVVFGLCGYTVGHVFSGNYDIISAGAWIGWVLSGVILVVRKPSGRSAALLAFAVGMQLLSGYATSSFYTWLAVGIISIVFVLQYETTKRIHALLWLAVGLGLGVLAAAIQLLPNVEFTQRIVRAVAQSYSWQAIGSIPPRSFVQLFIPFPFGGLTTAVYMGSEVTLAEHLMYVGLIGTLCSLMAIAYGMFTHGRRLAIRVVILGFLVVCIFAMWTAMGRFAPLDMNHILWKLLPPYRFVRIPGRFVYLIDAALSVLVGLGVSILLQFVAKQWRWVFGLLLLFCVGTELFIFARNFIVVDPVPTAFVDASVATLLSTRLAPGERFHEREPYDLWHDAHVMYRLPSTNGYDIDMLRDPYAFETAVLGLPESKYTEDKNYPIPADNPLLRYLAVRYSLEEETLDSGNISSQLGQHKVASGHSRYGTTYAVYRNDNILPLWYLAPSGKGFATRTSLYEAIQSHALPYESVVGFIGDPPHVPGNACTEVHSSAATITTFLPNDVQLKVTSACSGYLTGSQVYYPGWTATIDGKSVPIYTGNLGFATLVMPAGTHEVVLRFHSTFLPFGFMISLTALCSIGGLFVFERMRRKRV